MSWWQNLLTKAHLSRTALEAVINSSHEGIVVCRAVHNWKGDVTDFEFVLNNHKASEFLDRPSDQIVGRRLLNFLDPVQSEACFARYLQVYKTGEELQTEIPSKVDSVDHWYRTRIKKIESGIVTFFEDITIEKYSGGDQAALNGMKEALLQTPSASLWTKNLDGTYTFANRGLRELVGLRFWQIVGKKDSDLFPADVAREFYLSDRQVVASKAPQTMVQHFRVGGSLRTVFTQKFPITNAAGEIIAIGGIASETRLSLSEH